VQAAIADIEDACADADVPVMGFVGDSEDAAEKAGLATSCSSSGATSTRCAPHSATASKKSLAVWDRRERATTGSNSQRAGRTLAVERDAERGVGATGDDCDAANAALAVDESLADVHRTLGRLLERGRVEDALFHALLEGVDEHQRT